MANWTLPLEQLAERTNNRLEDVIRTVTFLIFERVIMRSPVDTGRFRANWNVSYDALDTTVTFNVDPTGGATVASMKNAVLASRIGGIVYMCNSLPYALVLEYGGYPNPPLHGSKRRGEDAIAVHTVGGYSMQAPNGMVRVTAREFSDAINDAVERLAV